MTTKWQADPERGVSLIEVMVAVLVLSIGLLGMASLMGVSLRNTQSANYRTQAANLAYEYIDTARAYIAIGGGDKLGYILQPAWSAANCDIATAPLYNCGGGLDSLNCDIRRLGDHVCRVLPGGRLRATAVPLGGNPDRLQLTVDICWTDDRSGAGAVTAACNSDSESLFSLVTEL
ncbi:MAG: type IV pilus modification protein PilV [Dechloromonas sp.]|jgi:type IV pilus assembly protein PilV|nr:MAG: type IV pilus modification protein PilV [Dechloromonas sp.]